MAGLGDLFLAQIILDVGQMHGADVANEDANCASANPQSKFSGPFESFCKFLYEIAPTLKFMYYYKGN